tara:strand:- start:4889 stop:5383 length:495 start_codon:yes stop_codon:yes gene_type:complete
MSGITFNPLNTDTDPPADPPAGDVVMFDGWWPSINITAVREAVRIDTTVTPDRLRDSVRHAMLDIAQDLEGWRAQQEAAGHTNLEAVPARREIDGQSDYLMRFNRAVYSVVGGDVGERQLGSGLTSAGADRAEQLKADVDVHARNVSAAVRAFLGLPRIRARLC